MLQMQWARIQSLAPYKVSLSIARSEHAETGVCLEHCQAWPNKTKQSREK